MTDQPQHHTEAGLGEQASVLCVRDLPYLTERLRGDVRALEEGDGSLAGQNSEVISVGLGEEVGEGAFFFGREVEKGLVS